MSDNKKPITKANSELSLKSREKVNISGIKEIISFDESEVNLSTVCGNLVIDGENMHINVLNISDGDIELHGKINGVNYIDVNEDEKHSLLSRIFK